MVTVGDKNGIAKMKGDLDALLKEYSAKADKNQNSLITPDARKAAVRAVKLLDEGMLGDPAGVNMYFLLNPGAEGSPKYLTIRGESQIECFWKKFERICAGANTSPVLADTRSLHMVFRHNLACDLRKCGLSPKPPTFDMSLIASINHNADRSGLQKLPYSWWKHPRPGDRCDLQGCGAWGDRHAAFDTFEQISSSLPEEVLVKLQKKNPKQNLGSSRDLPAGVGPITNKVQWELFEQMAPEFCTKPIMNADVWEFDTERMARRWNHLLNLEPPSEPWAHFECL